MLLPLPSLYSNHPNVKWLIMRLLRIGTPKVNMERPSSEINTRRKRDPPPPPRQFCPNKPSSFSLVYIGSCRSTWPWERGPRVMSNNPICLCHRREKEPRGDRGLVFYWDSVGVPSSIFQVFHDTGSVCDDCFRRH